MFDLTKSLRAQVLFAVGLLFVLINLLVISISAVIQYESSKELAQVEAVRIADKYGMDISSKLEQALDAAKTLSNTIQANSKQEQLTRKQFTNILKLIYKKNTTFQGVYSYSEPGAYDDDAEPFQCWWYRDGDKDVLEEKDEYTTDWGGEDWYTLPKRTLQPQLLEPYFDSDINIPMISSVTPIIQNGKFMGMIGIDITIDYMQSIADNADIFSKSGKLTIISNNGSVCALTGGFKVLDDGDEKRMPLITEVAPLPNFVLYKIKGGEEFVYESSDTQYYFIPLHLGDGISKWSVMVSVPNSVIYSKSNKIVILFLIFGSLITVLALFFLSHSIKKLIKPLENVIDRCGDISQGDLSNDMGDKLLERKDEVGVLANSFQKLIDSLKEKVAVAKQIANGELTFPVNVLSDKDELGLALYEMKSSLSEMVTLINAASDSIRLGTNEITHSSQALSDEATKTAQSVGEITSTINDVKVRASESSDKLKNINNRIVETHKDAETCNEQMQQLSTTMEDITAATNNISKIIKTIDGIAFQTNLLALNAAVEAARAGQHGKGFAVVADEVRNLANRSAKAAKETTELINRGLERVTFGESLSQQTANSFQGIVDSSNEVSRFVAEIKQSYIEESENISNIAEGLEQIAAATHITTANAEETASAIQELSSQSKKMAEVISKFNLNLRSYHL